MVMVLRLAPRVAAASGWLSSGATDEKWANLGFARFDGHYWWFVSVLLEVSDGQKALYGGIQAGSRSPGNAAWGVDSEGGPRSGASREHAASLGQTTRPKQGCPGSQGRRDRVGLGAGESAPAA